jgi:hypothetical protein
MSNLELNVPDDFQIMSVNPINVKMRDLTQKQWNALYQYERENRITVGSLRRQLSEYSGDTEITFGCTIDATPLVFYRVKCRGDKLVQIELNELR